MNHKLNCCALALCVGTLTWPAVVVAAAEEVKPASEETATHRCEAAVTQAIQKARGQRAQHVRFVAARRALATTPLDESGVKGEGHFQGVAGAMPFSYSCTFNALTSEITGVIFSESGQSRRQPEKPWQADLTHLAPEACEAAAAAALTGRFPRAANIVFDSNTRQLKPAPNAHSYLEGKGSLERAAGMNPAAFSYRCEFDSASGKFVGVQTDRVK